MSNNFARMTTTRYSLKEGTKTVFVETEREERLLDEQEYKRIVDASPFFRSLGGSETIVKNYTCRGYIAVRITSKSPSKTLKTIREFDFNMR